MTLFANCHRNWAAFLGASTSFFISTVALAQTPPPEAPPALPPATMNAAPQGQPPPQNPPPPAAAPAQNSAPLIHLVDQTPPPPPPVARTDKTHDGFYLRLNAGFGSQSTSLDDGTAFPNPSGSGGTLNLGLLVGGAPSPGVILGGALLIDNMPSTTLAADDGFTLKTASTLATLGPFIDGYPNSRGGFHLGGTVGFSTVKLSNKTDLPTDRANGFGLAAWLGYDWWVADQWSVGGLLQLSGAHASKTAQGIDMSVDTRSIALMFTAVYQ